MKIPSPVLISVGLSVLQGCGSSLTRADDINNSVVPELEVEQHHVHSKCSEVFRWIPPRQQPAIVLQVVSESFVHVQENFLNFMESQSSFTRDNLYLMCMGDEARIAIEDLGIPCVPMDKMKSYRQLWNLRVNTLGCLLEGGWDVLHSDSDALWLSDPIVDMASTGFDNFDIVTQRGSFPKDLGKAWGVTMCMGFALFRSRNRKGQ